MNVIKFPGVVQEPICIQRPEFPRLLLDTASFTCLDCNAVCDLTTRGMVFRTIDFYCLHCGKYYKITNPAFGHSTKKK